MNGGDDLSISSLRLQVEENPSNYAARYELAIRLLRMGDNLRNEELLEIGENLRAVLRSAKFFRPALSALKVWQKAVSSHAKKNRRNQ